MNFILLSLAAIALNQDPPVASKSGQASGRREVHQALVKQYWGQVAEGKEPSYDDFAPRFMRLAEENPRDLYGYDALTFFVLYCDSRRPEFLKAMKLLTCHHTREGRISLLLPHLVSPRYFGTQSKEIIGLLRDVWEKNPDQQIQAEACFGLAQFLANRAAIARQIRKPEGDGLARRMERLWGESHVANLRTADPDALARESSSLFNRGHELFRQHWESLMTYGKTAPEIAGADIDGRPMSLGDHRGKVIMLNFWGTGCPGCIARFPHERELVRRLGDRPFVLLGIANDRDRAKVKRMIDEKRLTWRSWWDGEDLGFPMKTAWKVRSWPAIYLLDHHGVIRYRDIGGAELDVAVDSLLNEVTESESCEH